MNINLITKLLVKRLCLSALMITSFLMVQSWAKAQALQVNEGVLLVQL